MFFSGGCNHLLTFSKCCRELLCDKLIRTLKECSLMAILGFLNHKLTFPELKLLAQTHLLTSSSLYLCMFNLYSVATTHSTNIYAYTHSNTSHSQSLSHKGTSLLVTITLSEKAGRLPIGNTCCLIDEQQLSIKTHHSFSLIHSPKKPKAK